MATVSFKYGIGDHVRLIKRPIHGVQRKHYDEPLPNNEYEISSVEWVEVKPNVFDKYYQLKITDSDNYLSYSNKIKEDEIEAAATAHPFNDDDTEFRTIYNDIVSIGTNVYTDIFFGSEDDWYIAYDFNLVRYGKVTSLHKFINSSYSRKSVHIVTLFEQRDNENAEDFCALKPVTSSVYDDIKDELVFNLLVNPQKIIEDYVNELCNHKSKILIDGNKEENNLVKSWLNHMGIYENVLSCWISRQPQKQTIKKKIKNTIKTKSQSFKKINNFLSGLSDIEMKQLKKLLLVSPRRKNKK